jgi:hypothetical protein
MTIKSLPGQEPEKAKKATRQAEEEKPLIREFLKRTSTVDGVAFPVCKAKLTMNGWLLIETEEWVGFINGKAAVALALIDEIAPNLHNQEANSLVAVVSKKNKFGFVLGLDDSQKRWYHWDSEAFCLTIAEEQDQSFLLPSGTLTLEDFLGTQSSSSKLVGQENREKFGAKKQVKN